MADKFTLLELHLHADNNEFKSDMEISSDLGSLLQRRLGLGGESEEETEEDDAALGEELKAEVDERTPIDATADGGDTVQVDEEEEGGEGAVVEIDPDADVSEDGDEDEDESSGRSKTKMLFTLLLLVGIVFLAKRYLDGDGLEDEFEDEFEEL